MSLTLQKVFPAIVRSNNVGIAQSTILPKDLTLMRKYFPNTFEYRYTKKRTFMKVTIRDAAVFECLKKMPASSYLLFATWIFSDLAKAEKRLLLLVYPILTYSIPWPETKDDQDEDDQTTIECPGAPRPFESLGDDESEYLIEELILEPAIKTTVHQKRTDQKDRQEKSQRNHVRKEFHEYGTSKSRGKEIRELRRQLASARDENPCSTSSCHPGKTPPTPSGRRPQTTPQKQQVTCHLHPTPQSGTVSEKWRPRVG